MKSMMGEALREADIGENGIPGDRGWAVRDKQRGGIRGGKKIPQLMTLAAQSGSAAPLITAPVETPHLQKLRALTIRSATS